MTVSTNYRALQPEEVAHIASRRDEAWKNPLIPHRQYELVQAELDAYKKNKPIAPYDVFVKAMATLNGVGKYPADKFLDIGASTGYYRELLRENSYGCIYQAVDYSPEYKKLAESVFPQIYFDVADARALPYRDDWYDIVLSGACIMHIREYDQVIKEAARVASQYVILHRTPIVPSGPTIFYEKDAYGIPCLEVWFNQDEIMDLCAQNHLSLHAEFEIFSSADHAHKTFVLKKAEGLNHVQV